VPNLLIETDTLYRSRQSQEKRKKDRGPKL